MVLVGFNDEWAGLKWDHFGKGGVAQLVLNGWMGGA